MSEQVRQIELFAAQDWQTIYAAFQQVNFSSYDYDTIRTALIDYIRINYPEEFNDYVESSEFIEIINVLSYLGQNLAFRVDLNTRENFLTDAQQRSSILKLAQFLSYVPNRAITAQGTLKVTTIQTDDNVLDSMGRNLIGVAVDWNQSNNSDWYEQFIAILNAALQGGAKFGQPVQSVNVQGTNTQIYTLNSVVGGGISYPFTATVAGQTLTYEIYNSDISDLNTLEELTPSPTNPMNIVYMNDGQGNGSPNTGFFLPFKQGSLTFTDFSITTPQQNRILIPDIPNVSNDDVWVESVTDTGLITSIWTQVPSLFQDNLVSNSVPPPVRQIYQVVTQEGDRVGIRFSDGVWGALPVGNIRVWTRQVTGGSAGPSTLDLPQVNVIIPYVNNQGVQHNLTLTLSLETNAIDGTMSESNTDIAQRAPMVYTTRNRMVTGDDYNIFPLSTNVPLKISAINRVYAGSSRYSQIEDFTGVSANLTIYSNDGMIYRLDNESVQSLSNTSDTSTANIMSSIIQPMVDADALRDFYYYYFSNVVNTSSLGPSTGNWLVWMLNSRGQSSSTGNFYSVTTAVGANPPSPTVILTTGGMQPIGTTTDSSSIPSYITVGSMVQFANAGWVTVTSITSAGIGTVSDGSGAVSLNEFVDSSDYVIAVIPAFNATFSSTFSDTVESNITNRLTFGLGYNYQTRQWYLINSNNLSLNTPFSLQYAQDQSGLNLDSSWLFNAVYSSTEGWTFTSRGIEYVFESVNDCRFYLASAAEVSNVGNELAERDNIEIIPANLNAANTKMIGQEIDLTVVDGFTQSDGTYEPRRVIVRSIDVDNDGMPDNPVFFNELVPTNSIIHWQITNNGTYSERVPVTFVIDTIGTAPLNSNSLTGLSVNPNDVVFFVDLQQYYSYLGTTTMTFGVGATLTNTRSLWIQQTSYEFQYGRNDLMFQWRHYAPDSNRIDPSATNIIDLYVLTTGYYTDVLAWQTGGMNGALPTPPTSAQIESQMSSLDSAKMISDELVYHPASFKLLFGALADPELQATFKVVQIIGDTTSENTLKNQILSTINTFLDPRLWDFGETFYFSQLAAYIHTSLAMSVASIAIVPSYQTSTFGNLYQVTSLPNEIFLNVATLDNIEIVSSLNPEELNTSS